MSNFIKIQLLIFTALFIAKWTVLAEGEIGTYDAYRQSIEKICYATTAESGGIIPIWNRKIDGEIPPPLTTFKQFVYPDIFDPKAADKYNAGLKALKGSDRSALEEYESKLAAESENLPLGSSLERAGIAYRERMNTIYACAVLNTKLRIHNRLIEQFKPESSNMIDRLKETSRQITTRMNEMSCLNIADSGKEGSELSLKRALIRDSTLEYCNYRHYLGYADYVVGNRIWEVVEAEFKARGTATTDKKASDLLPLTDNIAAALSDFAGRSAREIAQTQGAFTEAFEAYREFDRNYASHVLMILIEDRYLVVREYLRDTMNPIGQVIYQASNATSPGK